MVGTDLMADLRFYCGLELCLTRLPKMLTNECDRKVTGMQAAPPELGAHFFLRALAIV